MNLNVCKLKTSSRRSRGFQDGTQDVTKQYNCIKIYETTSLKGGGGKDADISNFGNEWSVKPKQKKLHINTVLELIKSCPTVVQVSNPNTVIQVHQRRTTK